MRTTVIKILYLEFEADVSHGMRKKGNKLLVINP